MRDNLAYLLENGMSLAEVQKYIDDGVPLEEVADAVESRLARGDTLTDPVVVATYDYRDSTGKLLAQKLRLSDKTFKWRQPAEGGGWISNRKGVPHVLYVAGELTGAVFVTGGEKDADAIHGLGWNAACGEYGPEPGRWYREYTDQLRRLSVAVLFKNNQKGRGFAIETCNALHGAAKSVHLLDLADVWPDIPEHADVYDMMEYFGQKQAAAMIAELVGKTPEWTPTSTASDTQSAVVKASDVPYEPPRWTIAPYFQRGKGTLIQGDPGGGKTAFMCAIAAHITTGVPILGIEIATPGDVLILSVEDDLPVLRGRLEANRGDLTKCHFMTNAAGLTFNSPEVEAAIKQVSAKMVIFDPFQAFLGARVDMFRGNETRPELAKLFEMCERNDCACAIIAHLGKTAGDKSPVNRSLGSVDIPASMRSILQLIRNPENEDECVMVHVKCSNAPRGQSLAYTIGDRGGIQWSGFSPLTVDDLSTVVKRKEKGIPYEREPLVQVFNQLITDRPGGGFWSYSDLKSEGAKILGFPPYSDLNDLRQRLDNGLARELQKRDGLIVIHGAKGRARARGIRIEQYQLPEMYQAKF